MRARLARLLCLACVSLVSADPARAAVADYLGRPIGSIRLVVEARDTTEPLLTQLVSTVPGQPLSMIQVREAVAAPVQPWSVRRRNG